MEFRVLGDLEAWRDGLLVPLGAHQQRAVLAMLVVHAGELVSVDRLIEGVWDEQPPTRAAKAIHVHVSRLRHAFAAAGETAPQELICTCDHGYVLRTGLADVDSAVFERLLEEGRQAHAAERFEQAAGVLGDALALWRGPALAEFAFDAFAREEIARLEELRVEAAELRIDADLALGRHAALVAELEALTARHPLRERLTLQRMLALYRCGRQSEALAVYRAARASLVTEVGIEPGAALRELHAAILRQDADLDASVAARPRTLTAPAERRPVAPSRRSRVLLGLGVLGCAGALALTVHGRDAPVAAGANSVAVIDPGRNPEVQAIAVGARPGDISAGAGRIWVANLDDRSVSEIDPRSAAVTHAWFPGPPIDGLAAGAGAVWTIDRRDATASRIDPVYGTVAGTVRLGPTPWNAGVGGPSPVAVADGRVWVSTGSASIARIDPRARRVGAAVAVGNDPAGIAVGAGAVWVTDDADDTVARIDGAGHVTTLPVGQGASGIAVGAGGVWVANTLDDTVTRIDPVNDQTKTTIPVGAAPRGVAVGLGAVWVANSGGDSVSRIDPRRDRVVQTIKLGGSPEAIAIAAGRAWVTVQSGAPPPGKPISGGTLRVVQTKDFGSTDPATLVSYGQSATQLEFATCAKLLNYPDLPGPRGLRLVPEVAARMPTVSHDGTTYTFSVRPGFRFSPPSNEIVTSRAFQRALERYLTLQPVGGDLADIVGADAYRTGRTARVAGVTATAHRLTIRLVRPSPSLPARMAMPSLCAVPPATPIRAGVADIASAGPYYIHSHTPGSELVLRRNPNYHGPRPRRFETIDYRFGATPAHAAALVQAGQADYADAELGQLRYASAVSPTVDARLERDYGPHSRTARNGRQRYFINPALATQYLLLNPHRRLFASPRTRQAVNFAIDRSALARYAQPGIASAPTDQLLPPGLPGFRAADRFPLGGPDAAHASRLAGHHPARAVMYTCNSPDCLQLAEAVGTDLRAIGIAVALKRFSFTQLFQREATPGEPYDIGLSGWVATYADPATFIAANVPGLSMNFPGTQARRYRRRIAAAAELTGQPRLRAYGHLDLDLTTHLATVIPFSNNIARDFFSARVGCQTYQPLYGIDLGALCQRDAISSPGGAH